MTQDDCIDYYEEYLGRDERGCCLLCPDAEPDCLCHDCKCTKCYWYEPDYDSDGGSCTYPRQKDVLKNKLSDKKIRNVVKYTSKAVYSEIEGMNGLFWIPKSVIGKDGYVKEWFIKNKQKEGY